MSDFIYTDLDQAKASIRLLTIRAAHDRKSPVDCFLSCASLDDKPDFEALSYTWGPAIEGDNSDQTPGSIQLEGSPFMVTRNLHDALIHLRLADKDRVIWVDAVCINQTNLGERNHQVRQMAQIYSSAIRVVIWLGLADDCVSDAIAWLHSLEGMQLNEETGKFSFKS